MYPYASDLGGNESKDVQPNSDVVKKNSEPSLDNSEGFKLDIDRIIRELISSVKNDSKAPISMNEMQALAIVGREQFRNETLLLEISAPLRICGDIHGQFTDLIRIFKLAGFPPDRKYLFLGDYVDRGRKGLECICLLLAYKIKYPTRIYLLRGNHESEAVSRIYGFREEIIERFNSSKLWWTFLRTFNYLPLAAVVDNSIFCCHGGISPEFMRPKFHNLSRDLNKIPRPLEVPLKGLICDLLWADPLDQVGHSIPIGFLPNERGCSWSFGYDVVENFLEKFDLDLIVRAHQVVEDGYEFYANRKLITIFSAPNYCGEFDNAASIFCLDTNEEGRTDVIDGGFLILKPAIKPNQNVFLKSLGGSLKNIIKTLRLE